MAQKSEKGPENDPKTHKKGAEKPKSQKRKKQLDKKVAKTQLRVVKKEKNRIGENTVRSKIGWVTPETIKRSRLTPGYDRTSSISPWEGHRKISKQYPKMLKKSHSIQYQNEIQKSVPQ